MADIKTILRELSVILGIILAKYRLSLQDEFLNVKTYLEFIRKHCSNIDEHNEEVVKIEQEGDLHVHKSTIINGIKLGKLVQENLKLEGDICWVGSAVKSKYPFDITVGGIGISLKEDSYILKNPSFSDYLNALTQPEKPLKKVHVFRKFASIEFNEWFEYSYQKLVEYAKEMEEDCVFFTYSNDRYFIKREEGNIVFGEAGKEISFGLDEKVTEMCLNSELGGDILEHTFSKWINKNLDGNDDSYLELKKNCSIKAGQRLKEYVNENQNISSFKIFELIQIYDEKYYYGKCHKSAMLYEVPSNTELEIELKDIQYVVPESQLNMHFTFIVRNALSEEEIEFRVECRYSHGQFKGIPEAKLYYTDRENDLKNIYKLIAEKP
jgi:imidazoleglycerol phosphate dehydratase HisB